MDIFVVHYADYDSYDLYYVGIEVYKAFEVFDSLGDNVKARTDVELWTDGRYVRNLGSVDDYISHQPHDY